MITLMLPRLPTEVSTHTGAQEVTVHLTCLFISLFYLHLRDAANLRVCCHGRPEFAVRHALCDIFPSIYGVKVAKASVMAAPI